MSLNYFLYSRTYTLIMWQPVPMPQCPTSTWTWFWGFRIKKLDRIVWPNSCCLFDRIDNKMLKKASVIHCNRVWRKFVQEFCVCMNNCIQINQIDVITYKYCNSDYTPLNSAHTTFDIDIWYVMIHRFRYPRMAWWFLEYYIIVRPVITLCWIREPRHG